MKPAEPIPPSPIRVSIVEDNARVRDHLTRLIDGAGNLKCLGAHSSGEQALARIPAEDPDVVLMDIHLDGLSGIECVRQLKAQDPELLVVMLTSYEDEDLIFQALKAGASGYLLKQIPPAELLAAIADAHQGGAPMTSNIARKVIRSFHAPVHPQPVTAALTPREREILDYLAQGYQYKEIADLLGVRYETIHSHTKTIYGKLHVRSRSEAVVRYLQR